MIDEAKAIKELIELIDRELKAIYGGRCGVAIAYSKPPDYTEAGYASNLKREEAVDLFRQTASEIQSHLN